MPVVPMSQAKPQAKGPRRLQDTRPPPSTPFALMAAAQMHSEGRLLPPVSTEAPDIYETRPQASMGGRSPVEANNPELGPSDVELRARVDAMNAANRDRVK